jgi:septal ring-binding cell division protein DamX
MNYSYSTLTNVLIIVLVFAVVPALTGCAKDTSPTTLLAQPVKTHEPWFCQTGESTKAWDCVQDLDLSNKPQPIRKPPERVPSREATPAVPPVSEFAQSRPPRPEPSVQPIKPAPQTKQPVKQASTPRNLPKYIRLAYRPEQATSLIDLPAEFWAVQLIALSNKQALESYARKQGLRGLSAAKINKKGALFYVLLLGIYETKAIAQEAISDLGPAFDKPWIRSLGSLQSAMLDAEQLTEGR